MLLLHSKPRVFQLLGQHLLLLGTSLEGLCVSLQVPLLFSKCCYHQVHFRASERSRLQTLQAVEQMVDKYRIGGNMYMQLAENLTEQLKSHADQSKEALKQQLHVSAVPHVKLLLRIKEPSLFERISCLTGAQIENVSV